MPKPGQFMADTSGISKAIKKGEEMIRMEGILKRLAAADKRAMMAGVRVASRTAKKTRRAARIAAGGKGLKYSILESKLGKVAPKLGPIGTGAGEKTASAGAKSLLKGPGLSGLLGGLMAYLIGSEVVGHLEKRKEIGLQERALEVSSPADMYYASQLPELQAERQAAQMALMQTILGGQGTPMPVPGERRIGY